MMDVYVRRAMPSYVEETAVVEAWDGTHLEVPEDTIGVVTEATYGRGDRWVSVRECVASHVSRQGSLSMFVSHETLGLPCQTGQVRSLRVAYRMPKWKYDIADGDGWEVFEGYNTRAEGVQWRGHGFGTTEEEVLKSRRRCLLYGMGGYFLTTGSVNSRGEESDPPRAFFLTGTQNLITQGLHSEPLPHNASQLNRAQRPGIHVAPSHFPCDLTWRPGMDPAPAPHIGWTPHSSSFKATAQQIRMPANAPEGTYFMCASFNGGYGGLQAHAGGKHHALFSIWGDDVDVVRHGAGVKCTKFVGGEGTGAGSYLQHLTWQADTAYTFLVSANPTSDNSCQFSCHIYRPEEGEWMLMACFERRGGPQQVGNPGGFLEDFAGSGERRFADWGPAWVLARDGSWSAVTKVQVSGGDRPNCCATCTRDHQRVCMVAGGDRCDAYAGSILFDGTLEPTNPPKYLDGAPTGVLEHSTEKKSEEPYTIADGDRFDYAHWGECVANWVGRELWVRCVTQARTDATQIFKTSTDDSVALLQGKTVQALWDNTTMAPVRMSDRNTIVVTRSIGDCCFRRIFQIVEGDRFQYDHWGECAASWVGGELWVRCITQASTDATQIFKVNADDSHALLQGIPTQALWDNTARIPVRMNDNNTIVVTHSIGDCFFRRICHDARSECDRFRISEGELFQYDPWGECIASWIGHDLWVRCVSQPSTDGIQIFKVLAKDSEAFLQGRSVQARWDNSFFVPIHMRDDNTIVVRHGAQEYFFHRKSCT